MKRLAFTLTFLFLIVTVFGQLIETTGTVRLRNITSKEGNVITSIPKGTIVTGIVDSLDYKGWTKVNFNGKIGFIHNNFVKWVDAANKYKSSDNQQNTNEKYYTNSKGQRVQSPTFSKEIPAGATAQCNDGTYSFSQSRRGTCSHHGGVKKWLK
jgi:Protein of unknown function (DUF3761)./Bacterial SH3 domain.